MLPVRKQTVIELYERAAQSALAKSPCFHGRNLSVEADAEVLVVRGVVKTPFQKRLAEQTVKNAVGQVPVVSEIELRVE